MSKEMIVFGSLYFDPMTDVETLFEAYRSVHDHYFGLSFGNIFPWLFRPDWEGEVFRALTHYSDRMKAAVTPGMRVRFYNRSGGDNLEFTLGRRSGEHEFMEGYLLKVFPTPPPGQIIDGSSIVDLVMFDRMEILDVFDSRRNELHEAYLAGQGVKRRE